MVRPRWQFSGDVCELARGERKFSGAPSLIQAGTAKAASRKMTSTCRFTPRFCGPRTVPASSAISARVFGRIGVNISEIWAASRNVEEEIELETQSYRLKHKHHEHFAFRHDFGARPLRSNAQGSGFDSQSRLHLDGAGVVSASGSEAQAIKAELALSEIYHSSRRRHGGLSARRTRRQNALGSGAHAQHGLACAAGSIYGIAHVIPAGFPPGSDVGNMSIMGYDPALYHTGRSPLGSR